MTVNKSNKSNAVFIVSLIIVVLIAIAGLCFSEGFEAVASFLMENITTSFGWLYLIAMFIFVLAALFFGFSKYGKIKLGKDGDEPEFSTLSWFGMLFGAGMGIGLVFWGTAEPISHLVSQSDPTSAEAASFAMRASFKHWGFHPWATYSVIGLALAYFQFRKGYPGLISSIFVPLIGEKGVNGWIGKTIDVLAVFATVAGVATSLGLGTMQINSGLEFVFGIPNTTTVNILIILIISVLYIGTAVAGLDKGIKVLGDINLVLVVTLAAMTFIVGPKLIMLTSFTEGLGQYLNNFILDSLHMDIGGANEWVNGWTVFYWAWWIAWAPFVGSFIARISKGRTIREFVMGVIFAPALASFIWFAIFGGLGLSLSSLVDISVLAEIKALPETALFVAYSYYPLAKVLSTITLVLLCTFFVTSANSATFVLGMFTSNGDLNPSNSRKVLWGVVQSLLATSLLLSGGLGILQTASIAAAFPFIFIMLAGIVSTYKALSKEEI